MRSKARHLVVLAMVISFAYVVSGGALAAHLSTHHHDHSGHYCHHYEHKEHSHERDNRHDSSHCHMCQALAVFGNKVFVEPPLLPPELSLTERSFAYSVSHIVGQHVPLPLQPRAPPA